MFSITLLGILTSSQERTKLKFQHVKWCAEFYDELHEFTERYLVSQVPCGQYSKIQVIDDWRALHDISTYGRVWLAKIRKENK